MPELNPINSPCSLPLVSQSEIEQYLASGLFRGIGKKTAALLVSHFGSLTLSVLENSPQQLSEIPGLYQYRIDKITQAWRESQTNPQRAAVAWLLGLGTPLGLTLKLCEHYGHRTQDVLQNNPYRLIDEIDGIGFKTADTLALSMGMAPDSQERYEQGIVQALKEALNDGHCFIPEVQLRTKALELLARPDHHPHPEKVQAVVQKAIAEQTLVEGFVSSSIYLKAVYRAELNVALELQARLEQPQLPIEPLCEWLVDWEEVKYRELSRLSGEQRQALMMAQQYPISILTGGPGRGKTHVLKTLVQWLHHQGARLALAAPTGKAATRMKNATDHPAQTIHRLLQWQGQGQSFLYNANNPLPIDWLIVDEFSMVDLFLFNSLLKALLPSTRVLLVGDANQLPSVGAGMVLRDLIVSELIRTTQLQTIYRQAHESPIIYAAEDVLCGRVPALHQFTHPQEWMDVGDCSLLSCPTPEATALAIVELVRQMKTDNIDLNQQLMVLAPQKQGAAGVLALNKLLQPLFNPKTDNQLEVVTAEVVYRVGDRVIQLKNRYDTIPAVMNGEMGRVVTVEPEHKQLTVEFEGGATVTYFPDSWEQVMHAFCMTCHKSQGSEFQYVIMPLVLSNRRLLTRQLVYTTITRASGTFIAVGQPEALEVAVATDKPARRYTQLGTLLVTPTDELRQVHTRLGGQRKTTASPSATVTIATRLRQRSLVATKGQMTTMGSLALRMYEDKFGHRPSKQPEMIEGMRFKTYHYGLEALDLIDQAINLVLNVSHSTSEG